MNIKLLFDGNHQIKEERDIMMKKRILAGLLVAGMTVSMVACGSSDNTAKTSEDTKSAAETEQTTQKGSDKLTHVTIAENAFIGDAPLYVAIKKGFFEDYGIDIEMLEFDDQTNSYNAVASGNADIARGTLDAALVVADKYSDDMPQVVSVTDDSAGADGIVAMNGIDTVADLKGHTVAVEVNQVSHYLLEQAFAKNGLTDDDVKMVDMNASDAGKAFLAGEVDAAVTWEPYLSQASSSGEGSMIFSSKDAPGTILDVLMVSKESADSNDSWIPGVISAIEKGREYLFDDTTKDEAEQIVADQLGMSIDEVEGELATVKLYTPKEACEALSEGGLAYEGVSTICDFYTSIGSIEKEMSADEVLNTSFVSQINE